MSRPLALAVMMIIASVLAGCNLVPERTPITLFELPAERLASAPETSMLPDTTLRLAVPRASGFLDGSRIIVMPQANQLQAYENVRWADNLPQLLRDRLLDAFQDNGRLSRVHSERTIAADVELQSDLRAFHSEYHDGLPEATLRLDVRLVDSRSLQLIASQRFIQKRQAASEAIPDVVVAFGAAVDELAHELVEWTAIQIANQ